AQGGPSRAPAAGGNGLWADHGTDAGGAMSRSVKISLVIAVSGVLPLAGCGYQQAGNYNQPLKGSYQWHSLYREDVQTVAVPIFGNRDFRRGVEFSLSKAVVNQLEAHSPYKVVSREHADTVLEGEIAKVDVNTLSRTYQEGVP